MKRFEDPELIIKTFDIEDVITASLEDGEDMGDWA